jgi:phage portal protein BeeE
MKVIPGPDGWPEGYEYTAGGQSIRFMEEVLPGVRPILHVKMFHPVNDHYGLSPIEAAGVAIDIHNEASKWNKALLDNSARPSGALVYAAANGQMTGEQFQRLKDELEASYQGARHAGRPLLLEGGLDWKPLSLSPKDMDFIEAKNSAAREIALALGVPEFSVCARRSPAGSRPPGAEHRGASAEQRRSGAAALELRPDLDQVEALNPEREALWARRLKLLSPARRGRDVPDRRREARCGGVSPAPTVREILN